MTIVAILAMLWAYLVLIIFSLLTIDTMLWYHVLEQEGENLPLQLFIMLMVILLRKNLGDNMVPVKVVILLLLLVVLIERLAILASV